MNAGLRWIGGSLLVAGLGYAALLPETTAGTPARARSERTALAIHADSLRAQLAVVNRVVERGAVRALARGLPAGTDGAPRFVFDAGVGPRRAGAIERTVRGELAGAGVTRLAYPVTVRATIDTSLRGAYHRVGTALPERPGDPCVVVVLLTGAPNVVFNESASRRLLGACAFFAAHGAPSAATARWLRENRGGSAAFYVLPSAWRGDTSRITARVSALGLSRSAEFVIRCNAGDLDACEGFVGPLEEARWWFDEMNAMADYRPLLTEFPGTDVGPALFWSGIAGRIRSGFLSELRLTVGDERFTALWRDERGLTEAYRGTTGQRIGTFVRDMIRERTLRTTRGPAIPFSSALLAMSLVVLGFLASTRLAGRRMDV